MRTLTRLSLLAAAAALVAAACGGDDGGTGPTPPPPPPGDRPVASVEVSPNPASVAVGRTLQLAAVIKADDGTPLEGRTVAWRSSNETIATVSATGTVTGVAPGDATITGTSEGKSGTAVVRVTATPTGGRLLTWVGGAPGAQDWSDPAHWSPAATPGATDTVHIPVTSSDPVLSRDVQVARLVISGGWLRTYGQTLTIRQP